MLAVLADTHDRGELLDKIISNLKAQGITHGIHLGDFCAPPVLQILSESGIHWTCVWGNCDADRLNSARKVDPAKVDLPLTEHRAWSFEGRDLFLTHYPEIAQIAAKCGEYDAVFYGHNHTAATEVVEHRNATKPETLLANPGSAGGVRVVTASYGLYDPATNRMEHVVLE